MDFKAFAERAGQSQSAEQYLCSLLLLFFCAIFSLYWVRKKELFKLEEERGAKTLPYSIEVLSAFGIYLGIEFLLTPVIAFAVVYLVSGKVEGVEEIPEEAMVWLIPLSLLLAFSGVFSYFLTRSPSLKQTFFGERNRAFDAISYGGMMFLVSYPLVISVSQLVSLLLFFVVGPYSEAQVAVEQLKKAEASPVAQGLMSVAIVTVVPVCEEILFRGFFHNHLKSFLGRKVAIFATAFLFSIFHFSSSQGWKNLEIFGGLFVLSIFLGFAYEKKGSLFAPIALHCAFNGLNLLFLLSGY